jgi:probable rRNA maturation factor
MAEFDIQILNEPRWEKINFNKIIKNCLNIIKELHPEDEISFVLCNDKTIQELNLKYRGQNKPTNVLSFAFNDDENITNMLGDIILSFETIEKEAEIQEKTFEDHLSHLVIHGILHLIGFDHIEDNDAVKMEKYEIELLAGLGIKNPY